MVQSRHTFWVFVICLFQVLNDAILANQLLNLALGIDVEGIFVEKGDLVVAFALGVLSLSLPHGEDLSPAVGVVGGVGELGVTLAYIEQGLGAGEQLLSHTLWIWVPHWGRTGRVWLLWWPLWLAVLASNDGQHLTIPNTGIFQCLCLLDHGLAVEVYAL